MPVTIVDVARLAGVSPGTISNTLSGKRPVAEATRERIFKVIAELGYEPNLLARSLVRQKSCVISIVIKEFKDLGYYGYSSTLTGIQQKAEELGYSLMLHFIDEPSDSHIQAVLNESKAHQAAGIIWAVHEFGRNREWVRTVPLEKYPPLVFLNMRPLADLTVVTIDNRAGAKMATEHLIAQGCRTIGLIAGPLDWWEAQERLAGWREGLEQAGLEAAESLIVEGDWLSNSGKWGMGRLLERRPDLDGVFACNDMMALGALHTAHAQGIKVPDNLRVVGFDNVPEAASFWPPLTSVKQGLNHLGAVAMQQLHEIIEAKENALVPLNPTQIVLQPELVVRASSLSEQLS